MLDKSEFVGVNDENLIYDGGTMGVGKTTVSQHLKTNLRNSVFLDAQYISLIRGYADKTYRAGSRMSLADWYFSPAHRSLLDDTRFRPAI